MSDSKDALHTDNVSLTREFSLITLFGCNRCLTFNNGRICGYHGSVVRMLTLDSQVLL
jgi:hypothetical protein